MLEMTYSGTQTTHIFDCCKTSKQKNNAERQQLKRHIHFRQIQSPLSLLYQFNKIHIEADCINLSKLAYWPARIATANRKSSKEIVSMHNLLPCILSVLLNLPCIFHITTPSTKWFLHPVGLFVLPTHWDRTWFCSATMICCVCVLVTLHSYMCTMTDEIISPGLLSYVYCLFVYLVSCIIKFQSFFLYH